MSDPLLPDTARSYSEMFRVKAARRDFDDLNHAIADRDVGRQRRHIQDDDVDPATGKKKDGNTRAIRRTLEWLLLNDAAYAQVHQRAMTKLTDAEDATAIALTQIMDALALERTALGQLEGRAARLEDGTLVLRDANGNIVDADGNTVPDDLAAGVEWRGDEPSYEEYQAQKQRVEDLLADEIELRGIETELGDIRGELTNNEEPPASDRVETLTDRIEDLKLRAERHIPTHDNEEPNANVEALERDTVSGAIVPNIKIGS